VSDATNPSPRVVFDQQVDMRSIENRRPTRMTELERALAGALSACVEQIEQMRRMFDDEDGTIAEAVDAADEALTAYAMARSKEDA
jgi:hypothetical protein